MEVGNSQALLLPSCMLNASQLNLLSNPVQLLIRSQTCSLAGKSFSLSGNVQKCSWEDVRICVIITSFSHHVCFESPKVSVYCTQHKVWLLSSPLSKEGIAGNVKAGLQPGKAVQLPGILSDFAFALPERPNGRPRDQMSTDRKHLKMRIRLEECAKAQVRGCSPSS